MAREQGVKERTVVVEYPSLEKARAAYDGAAYVEALKALGDGAVRDFRIAEGLNKVATGARVQTFLAYQF